MRHTLDMIPDKYVGEYEAPLIAFIHEGMISGIAKRPNLIRLLGDVEHGLTVSHLTREKGSITIELYLDTSDVPHYPPDFLQQASSKLGHALDAHTQEPGPKHPIMKTVASIASHAMSSLDHLVAIADDVAEVCPGDTCCVMRYIHECVRYTQ